MRKTLLLAAAILENHSLSDIIGNASQAPCLNSLATECGLATNYHSISHPSLPNYLAATSGLSMSQLPVLSYTDCSVSSVCDSSAPSIFGQGETWQAYQESMPSNCDKSNSGEYAIRHNPPPYFTSLSGCATDDVPYTQLATDLASNTLPAFSFITWDEGSGGSTGESCAASTSDTSCRVPMIVISPSTLAGATSATLFNHYSLLGTTEQLLGLAKLGQAASQATLVSAFNL